MSRSRKIFLGVTFGVAAYLGIGALVGAWHYRTACFPDTPHGRAARRMDANAAAMFWPIAAPGKMLALGIPCERTGEPR